MKLAFSTLGCPDWSLAEVLEYAAGQQVTGVELRALAGSLDLLARPEFRPAAVAETRRRIADYGVEVCCLDTSCHFDAPASTERRTQIEVALRHCALAAELGAPLVRIFPDRIPAGATREETRARIVESLRELAVRAPREVRIGLETHGDFAATRETMEILRAADHEGIVIVWDAANSFAAGDSINDSAQNVTPALAHVHLRDARPAEGEEHWRPVLSGRGLVPFGDVLRALSGVNYRGYISFEWEKYWRRDLEGPEIAIPDFLRAVRSLAEAQGIDLR